jgi:hypothetical protein
MHLIVYAPSLLARALVGDTNGCVPIDSCLYHSEVKSVLTASELEDSISKARDLKRLELAPMQSQPDARWPVVSALFAFTTDMKGKSELLRYVEKNAKTFADPVERKCSRPATVLDKQRTSSGVLRDRCSSGCLRGC